MSDHVGELTRRYSDLGMPVREIVVIREAAYQSVEVSETGVSNA